MLFRSVDGIARIRFTSPYPVDFSPRLIEAIATLPQVMPYVHMPVQSGSDPVLERMRRAMRNATSSGNAMPFDSAFASRMAARVSTRRAIRRRRWALSPT